MQHGQPYRIKVAPEVHHSLFMAIDEKMGAIPVRESGDGTFEIGGFQCVAEYLPHNVEAEAALLGALMIDNRLLDETQFLRPEHFFEPLYGRIFETIRALAAQDMVANPVTLRPYFETDETMAELGGAAHLAQLTGSGAALIGARDFARQIADLAELRALKGLIRKADAEIEDVSAERDAKSIAGSLESEIADTLIGSVAKTTVTFASAFNETVKEVEAIGAGGEPAGFQIARYHDWNAVVGRMEPADFILLGARPSMGKTAVGVTVALGAAENMVGTDFLSLEMDKRKATRRAIAQMIHDPDDPLKYQDLIDGRLRKTHWRSIVNAQVELEKLPLSISDPGVMYVEDVAGHIRKRQREFERRGWPPLQLLVLDYLGRLAIRRKIQNETEGVSYISRMLKGAAKETGVALVGLAQLSRAVETRDNKRPMLADLRQSGSLEQDADTVVFLFREEYYLRQLGEPPRDKPEKHQHWLDDLERAKDRMELYTSKRREGALAKRTSRFFTEFQAVLDHDDARLTSAPTFFDDGFPEMRG